jgi:hypothetical protein
LQLAHLRDPQVLAQRAKRLGMVVPPEPAFIRLSDGKVVGDPVVATSANAVRIRPFPARKPAALAPTPRIVHVKAPATGPASTKSGAPTGRKGTTARTTAPGATH